MGVSFCSAVLAFTVHFPVDAAASEELASEDIWGEDADGADTGTEDDSARLTAQSPEGAAPGPEQAAKAGARPGTRKRQTAASAQGDPAPKRQRRPPKQPQGVKKGAAAKPVARGAASKGAGSKKAGQSRKRSQGAGHGAAGPSEPDELSEAPSDMQAAKAEFMRTMGLPEPRAFSSGSKGAGRPPVLKPQPLAAPKRVRDTYAAKGLKPASGKGAFEEVLAEPQPSHEGDAPGSLPLQDIQEGAMFIGQQQPQSQCTLEQAHAKATGPAGSSAGSALRQEPGGVTERAAVQATLQRHAGSAPSRPASMSASPELGKPSGAAGPNAAAAPPASAVQLQQAALEQSGATLIAGAGLTAGVDQDHAVASNSGEAPPAQLGSSPVPASPEAPQPVQMLGGSGRPAENGVKLVNLLNPNNPQYSQAFALEYARMKCASCLMTPFTIVCGYRCEVLYIIAMTNCTG